MIRYNIKILLKNKVLMIWPAVAVLVAITILIWGNIQSARTNYSFVLMLGEVPVPSNMFLSILGSFVVFVSVIALPTHLAENLKPERASLLMSNAVSRTEFFAGDFGGVFLVVMLYSFITVFALGFLLFFKTSILPFGLLINLLIFLPLIIITYYITVVLLLLLTGSYMASVLVAFAGGTLSGFLLDAHHFLPHFGLTSNFWRFLTNILEYLIPSSQAMLELFSNILSGGWQTFHWRLLVFGLVSCIPFLALSFYLLLHKEF